MEQITRQSGLRLLSTQHAARSTHLPKTVRRVAMLSVHTSPLAQLGGPSAGGMNVYVRELARELARRGARVDIFTRREEADAPVVAVAEPGVRVIALPCGPFGSQDKNALAQYLPEFAAAVGAWAEANRVTYDLIHAHYWLSGFGGTTLALSVGCASPANLPHHRAGEKRRCPLRRGARGVRPPAR